MMKRVTTTANYQVAQDDVFLTIKIGDAQIGGSAVEVLDQIIASGQITKLKLGSGKDLKGSVVRTKTTVADMNDQTNRTSVTYQRFT